MTSAKPSSISWSSFQPSTASATPRGECRAEGPRLCRIVLVVSAAEAIISSAGKMVSAVYNAMLKTDTCLPSNAIGPVIRSEPIPCEAALDVDAESDGAHDFRPAELSHPDCAHRAHPVTESDLIRSAIPI
jgi:hypothetical protein